MARHGPGARQGGRSPAPATTRRRRSRRRSGPRSTARWRPRRREADEFYASEIPASLSDDERSVARQAYAGLLWTKQYYPLRREGTGSRAIPRTAAPPTERKDGRNSPWGHFHAGDVISMPDKWEYPWFAAWDLAFHAVPLARIDPAFARRPDAAAAPRVVHAPNGQMPAYEWALSDVNPPVHAWGCWRVYEATGPEGKRDRTFLARAFQKLLLNFTWWVNRKDARGRNLFAGGFLGLDNIGVFDRSQPLPDGTILEQADGTAWMAFFAATMLGDLHRARAAGPRVRGHGDEVLRALRRDRRGDERAGRDGPLGRGGRLLLRPGGAPGATRRDEGPLHGGPRPAVRRGPRCARSVDGLDDFRRRSQWFLDNRKDLAAADLATRAVRSASEGRPSSRSPRASGSSACCATCSTRTSSCRRSASARCRARTATIPT